MAPISLKPQVTEAKIQTTTASVEAPKASKAEVRDTIAADGNASHAASGKSAQNKSAALNAPHGNSKTDLIKSKSAPTSALVPTTLKASNVEKIVTTDARVDFPRYDRSKMKEGIVHFGVGAFHRAHLAAYAHDLMNRGGPGSDKWGICGVGLTPSSLGRRDKMASQDFLYTLVERDSDTDTAKVIGSIKSYLIASEDPEALIAKLASPETHIASMTLTGSGYYLNEKTGKLDLTNKDIAHDIHREPGQAPKTFYGFLADALARRKAHGLRPFTILSCDNMPENGVTTRDALLTFIAESKNQELADWVSLNGAFPNTMVDRITPSPDKASEDLVANTFGIQDKLPVLTEAFSQFVIQNKFSADKPEFEKVGVQFVKDVGPYGKMKQRLLNASHSAIGYLGALMGYNKVYELMADPLFHTYLSSMMSAEIPLIEDKSTGLDAQYLEGYKDNLLQRFGNVKSEDTTVRLTRNGSGKIPKFILASIGEHIEKGGDTKFMSLTVASWFRYLTGVGEKGENLYIEDGRAGELKDIANNHRNDVNELLGQSGVVNDNLLQSERFVGEVKTALNSLQEKGTKETLKDYIE